MLLKFKYSSRLTQRIALLLFFCCYFGNNKGVSMFVQNGDGNNSDFVRSESIKTVRIFKLGWELADPAIELNGSDRVVIHFDDLSDSPGTYGYSVHHCNADWELSSLYFNDYMSGFEVNEIKDFSFSRGTITPYMHCRLEIPNDQVNLKISGNYLLRVFSIYEPENILIQRRFIVYEPLVKINATVRKPSVGDVRISSQQVDLSVDVSMIKPNNPISEIYGKVYQNSIYSYMEESPKIVSILGNEISFLQPDALIFEGGNEYRTFDIKNIRYNAQGVKSIEYNGGMFHVQLTPDESRRSNRYTFYPDINGRYVVSLERSAQSNIEADYVWTYFTLKVPVEVAEGHSVYLYGEFTGWGFDEENRLLYSYEREAYEKRVLLKQGVYNYRYIVVPDTNSSFDVAQFEGDFFETENSYAILIYYKPIGARYDRLIGYKRITTMR